MEEDGNTASRLAVLDAVKTYFRPEFLNRVDEVVVFDELKEDDLTEILDLEVAKLEARIAGLDLKIEIDSAAKALMVNESAGPATGARGLRRTLEDKLQDRIADLIIDGNLKQGGTVQVSLDDEGQIVINVEAASEVQ